MVLDILHSFFERNHSEEQFGNSKPKQTSPLSNDLVVVDAGSRRGELRAHVHVEAVDDLSVLS